MSKYSLNDAFIIPYPKDPQQLTSSIAKAAAMYINHRIEDNAFINIGYGNTILEVLNNLKKIEEKKINFVSMTGGVNYYLHNTNNVYSNAQTYLIPSPLFLSTKKMAEVMESEISVQEIKQMSRHSSMSVIGIGSVSDDATIVKNGILSNNDLTYLKMQGAVGDILSHFIDENGEPINSQIEERLMSTDLTDLRNFNNVIGVAAGEYKTNAIKAVLKAQYLDVLITDEKTADILLKEE